MPAMEVYIFCLLLASALGSIPLPRESVEEPNSILPNDERHEQSTSPKTRITPANMTRYTKQLWTDDRSNRLNMGSDIRVDSSIGPGHRYFTYVDRVKVSRGSFISVVPLLNAYNRNLGFADPNTVTKERAFLQSIKNTEVMKSLRQYLRDEGLVGSTEKQFEDKMHQVWFTKFARTRKVPTVLDSSAWEHVFVGETWGAYRPWDPEVSGFHGWFQYYTEEAANLLKYQSVKKTCKTDLVNTAFTWHTEPKTGSSMFIGTTIEYEMAVYTLCYLDNTVAAKDCTISMDSSRTEKIRIVPRASPPTITTAFPIC